MLTKRTNRLAWILARTRVADWHASIKLTDPEWQELLEGELVTFHRPFTKMLWNLEQNDHKVVRLTGPKGGSVEAMITDIYRDDRGNYEITAQLTDLKAGKRYQGVPNRPELASDQYIIYETPRRNKHYVAISHAYSNYEILAGPRGDWIKESTYHGWSSKIPLGFRFYRIVGDSRWDIYWTGNEIRDLMGGAAVVRTGVLGDTQKK